MRSATTSASARRKSRRSKSDTGGETNRTRGWAQGRGAGRMVRGVRKRFGQHFLEPAWVDKVIRAIDPKPDELFIEIGPGRGALTRPLVGRAKAVMAFEIDRGLAAELSATAPPNLTVTQGDFLEQADFRLPTSDSVR